MSFDDLWKSYGELAPSAPIENSPPKERATQLLSVDRVGMSWVIGKSFVLLESKTSATLEVERESAGAAARTSRSRANTDSSRKRAVSLLTSRSGDSSGFNLTSDSADEPEDR